MPDLVCWKCGASLKEVPRPITRHHNCLACYAELHCCRMCRSYDTRYISKCSDERADTVTNKDSANFCEYFKPRPGAYTADEGQAARSAEEELRALFGDADGDTPDSTDDEAPDSA